MLKIFTIAHKRPDFIELQLNSFHKHLKEEFQFVVFNNAGFDDDKQHYNQINEACKRWNLAVIDIRKDQEMVDSYRLTDKSSCGIFNAQGTYSNPNVADAYPVQWSWKNYISNETGAVCMLHSDMFLTEPVILSDYLKNYEMCYVMQSRGNDIDYMWEGFVLLNMEKLPAPKTLNWFCGRIGAVGVDVGGMTHFYLKAHPELRKLGIGPEHHHDDPELQYEYLWLQDKKILHYGAGSNWNKRTQQYHDNKTQWMRRLLGI